MINTIFYFPDDPTFNYADAIEQGSVSPYTIVFDKNTGEIWMGGRLYGKSSTEGLKSQLNGNLADILPVATDTALGGVKIGYVSNSNAQNRTYGVQLDSSNRAYVSVPWTDTVTPAYDDSAVRGLIATEKARIDEFLNTLNAKVKLRTEQLLQDATWVTANLESGVVGNNRDEAIDHMLNQYGVWEWTDPEDHTQGKTLKISTIELEVDGIRSDVAFLQTNSQDATSVAGSITSALSDFAQHAGIEMDPQTGQPTGRINAVTSLSSDLSQYETDTNGDIINIKRSIIAGLDLKTATGTDEHGDPTYESITDLANAFVDNETGRSIVSGLNQRINATNTALETTNSIATLAKAAIDGLDVDGSITTAITALKQSNWLANGIASAKDGIVADARTDILASVDKVTAAMGVLVTKGTNGSYLSVGYIDAENIYLNGTTITPAVLAGYIDADKVVSKYIETNLIAANCLYARALLNTSTTTYRIQILETPGDTSGAIDISTILASGVTINVQDGEILYESSFTTGNAPAKLNPSDLYDIRSRDLFVKTVDETSTYFMFLIETKSVEGVAPVVSTTDKITYVGPDGMYIAPNGNIKADGTAMTATDYAVKLNSNGSGSLAFNKIHWDANGELVIDSGVTFNGTLGSSARSGISITAAQIDGTLSANKISGGTLTLGGADNGNGTIEVKKQNGSETVVTIDKNGVTANAGSFSGNVTVGGTTDGSITVKNASNNRVGLWDKTGLAVGTPSTGAITFTNCGMLVNSVGSGSIAKGNIMWDASGNVAVNGGGTFKGVINASSGVFNGIVNATLFKAGNDSGFSITTSADSLDFNYNGDRLAFFSLRGWDSANNQLADVADNPTGFYLYLTNPLDGHLITIDFTDLSFKDLNLNQVLRHEATFYRLSNQNKKVVETPVVLHYSLENNTTKWWLHSDSETELTSLEMGTLYKKQQVSQGGVSYSACVQEVDDVGTPYITTKYTLYELQTLQNNLPTKTGDYAMATNLNTDGSSSTDKWFVVPNTTTYLDSLNTNWGAVYLLNDGTVNSTNATTVIRSSNTSTVPTFTSAVSFISRIEENGDVGSILYPAPSL